MHSLRTPKTMVRPAVALTILVALLSAARCSEPPPETPKSQLRLNDGYKRAQTEFNGLEEQIKNASDSGLKDELSEQRELARSRMERLKDLGAVTEAKEAKGGGGGGHH